MGFTIAIYVLNILASIFIVFEERKRPVATLAWIMILSTPLPRL